MIGQMCKSEAEQPDLRAIERMSAGELMQRREACASTGHIWNHWNIMCLSAFATDSDDEVALHIQPQGVSCGLLLEDMWQ